MKNTKLTLILLTFLLPLLSGCNEGTSKGNKAEALKSFANQKNNKIESPDEIMKRLNGDNPNNYSNNQKKTKQ